MDEDCSIVIAHIAPEGSICEICGKSAPWQMYCEDCGQIVRFYCDEHAYLSQGTEEMDKHVKKAHMKQEPPKIEKQIKKAKAEWQNYLNTGKLSQKNKNLHPDLKYDVTYTSEEMNKYGNLISDNGIFTLKVIDIDILKERINEYRYFGYGFKSIFSMELNDGVGKGKVADWMVIKRYGEKYQKGLPVPPIAIDGTRICDGNHRLYALYKLKYKEINAFVKTEN